MTPLALDTSVAIPLMVRAHPDHAAVVRLLGDRAISIAGHAEVETLSVLTRLPGDARPDPATAQQLLTRGFAAALQVGAGASATPAVRIAAMGITGGAVYDALVALAALDNGAVLATRDRRAVPTYARVGVTVELIA